MGLTAAELDSLHWVIEALVDLTDRMGSGQGGTNEWQYTIRVVRGRLSDLATAAAKPTVPTGGICGWCHEYVSRERNLYRHVKQCRAEAVRKQNIAMRAAAESLTRLAKDLETK